MPNYNEITLAKELIKFPSITPIDAGIMKFLAKKLTVIGFNCKILEFKDKNNPSAPSLYCAVIIKQVDEKTRSKTSVNDLLRD